MDFIRAWKESNATKPQNYRSLLVTDHVSDRPPSIPTILAFSVEDIDRGWTSEAIRAAVENLKSLDEPQVIPWVEPAVKQFKELLDLQKEFYSALLCVKMNNIPTETRTIVIKDCKIYDAYIGMYSINGGELFMCRCAAPSWRLLVETVTGGVGGREMVVRIVNVKGKDFIIGVK